MRVAVIGAGGQAKLHAECLARMKDPTLACVAGRTRESASRLAGPLGAKALTIEECLSDTSIDAVVVAVPTSAHKTIALSALKSGKHVLCESPFALSLADADEMIGEAKQQKKKLLAGYVSPFDAEAIDLQQRLRKGDLGELRLITTERLFGRDPNKPTHHGDAVGELLTYDIHFLLWLFGDLSLTRAEGLVTKGFCFQVFAGFVAGDVAVRCEASQLFPSSFPFTVRTKVVGREGALVWQLGLPADAPPQTRYDRYDRNGARGPVALKPQDPFVSQLKHFAAVVRGDEPDDKISAQLARRTVELTLRVASEMRPLS